MKSLPSGALPVGAVGRAPARGVGYWGPRSAALGTWVSKYAAGVLMGGRETPRVKAQDVETNYTFVPSLNEGCQWGRINNAACDALPGKPTQAAGCGVPCPSCCLAACFSCPA